jgi:hypothetical protein
MLHRILHSISISFILTFSISILISGFTSAHASNNKLQPFNFSSYPTKNIYLGKPQLPNVTEKNFSRWHQMDTVLETIRQGPNFAGRYSVITLGCGTECVYAVMYDVSTGAEIFFPMGGEGSPEATSMSVISRRSSDLLIVKHFEGNTEPSSNNCTFKALLLKDQHFILVGQKSFKGVKKCGSAATFHGR